MERGSVKKGLFIVFEGIDGSGKTSQIERLARYIRAQDKYRDVLLTREPTWRATELLEQLQGNADAFSNGERMAYQFVWDRKAHTDAQIKPALEQRAFVLCDRYAMSTCAYQAAQGVLLDTLLRYHEEAQTLTPHITFFVDVPREVAEARMIKRGAAPEKFEKNATFTDLLIKHYRLLAEKSLTDERLRRVIGPVVSIDGMPSLDQVGEQIQVAYGQAMRAYSGRPKSFP